MSRLTTGQTSADARALLLDALGDLADRVEIEVVEDDEATASPVDTPLWDSLARLTPRWYGESKLVPFLTVGATDGRFFRRRGVPAYGFGLFSEHLTIEDFGTMFHGNDERVDQDSLRLSTELWDAVARDLLA